LPPSAPLGGTVDGKADGACSRVNCAWFAVCAKPSLAEVKKSTHNVVTNPHK
jgi:hypothetical protein